MISPAATDLGLAPGDALQIELQNKLDQAKKQAATLDGPKGLLGYALSPAAQSLGLGGYGG